MKALPVNAAVHQKTLVEQKTDFTAEGSPSPGKVAGSVPPITETLAVVSPASEVRHAAKQRKQ